MEAERLAVSFHQAFGLDSAEDYPKKTPCAAVEVEDAFVVLPESVGFLVGL